MNPWNLGGYAIAAIMVIVCARFHLDREAFSGVVQLAGTMVGGVAGVAIAGRAVAKAQADRDRRTTGPNPTLDSLAGDSDADRRR